MTNLSDSATSCYVKCTTLLNTFREALLWCRTKSSRRRRRRNDYWRNTWKIHKGWLFSTLIYIFLLLCLCILIVCLCIFIVPAGTLRLPWLRFFRAFSSVVRQMPEYNPQRRGTARTLPKFLCCSIYCLFCVVLMYCLCVNVYCTTATGCQPNCS